MGADEGTHRGKLVDPKIQEDSGRIVKTTGDGDAGGVPASRVRRSTIRRSRSISSSSAKRSK
jgi:hypothetical protein